MKKANKPSKSDSLPSSAKMMADLQRLLNQQDFNSIEDAKKFMQELMVSGDGYILSLR